MLPGMERMLEKISEHPENLKLQDRFLSLVSELPNEEQKVGLVLKLAAAVLESRPQEAMRLAYMVFEYNRHSVEAVQLLARCFRRMGKRAKAEVLEKEADRLARREVEAKREPATEPKRLLPRDLSSPKLPAADQMFALGEISESKAPAQARPPQFPEQPANPPAAPPPPSEPVPPQKEAFAAENSEGSVALDLFPPPVPPAVPEEAQNDEEQEEVARGLPQIFAEPPEPSSVSLPEKFEQEMVAAPVPTPAVEPLVKPQPKPRLNSLPELDPEPSSPDLVAEPEPEPSSPNLVAEPEPEPSSPNLVAEPEPEPSLPNLVAEPEPEPSSPNLVAEPSSPNLVAEPEPTLVQPVARSNRSGASLSNWAQDLDRMLHEGRARRALVEIRKQLEQNPDQAHAMVVWSRLPRIWKILGLQGFSWSPDEGAEVLRDRLTARSRQRLSGLAAFRR